MTNDRAETLESPIRREKQIRKSALTTAGLVIVVVGGILAYLVSDARHAVHETLCHANLFKIRHALLEYESVHGYLPSSSVDGPEGNPAHSWRVSILPHFDSWGIDGDGIYKSYDMTKPWNSTENYRLFQPVAESSFACPCGAEDGTILTSYVVFVGDDTLFSDGRTISASDIPNTADPILVLEITNSDIEWSEPRDLSIDELESTSSVNSLELTRPHAGCIRYITLSGKLDVLPVGTDLDVVRRLASINDQSAIGAEELP